MQNGVHQEYFRLRMSAELCVLYRLLPYEALQKSSYLRMPEKEAEVYDWRRARIGQLCEALAILRAGMR